MDQPEARRITGRHLLLRGPGVAIELPVSLEPTRVAERAAQACAALGWPCDLHQRVHKGGASLAMAARFDLLETACDLLDWAAGDEPLSPERVERLRQDADDEARPRLMACLGAMGDRASFWDDDGLTVGLGHRSQTWELHRLPRPDELPDGGRVPVAMVTGTNGKTTTTRMLARIAHTAGFIVGHTSSDAVVIDGVEVERGDWTGPGAARRVLRDPSVTLAVLETARGGLMRRGLVLEGSDVAVLTNVDVDHIGEWGLWDAADMARAKLVIADGLKADGIVVANARSALLIDGVRDLLTRRPDLQLRWFADGELADAHADEHTLYLDDTPLLPLAEIPLTFAGTARYNVENALAAALGAQALGLHRDQIAAGLRALRPTVADSRGRMNRFVLPNGAIALVDFAHNPDGLRRLGQAVAAWPGTRRTVLLGQAGDRSDDDLIAFAQAALLAKPDRVVLKELIKKLRGRQAGDVPAVLHRALVGGGLPPAAIEAAGDELDAVRYALDTAHPGELLFLLIHLDLQPVLDELEARGAVEL